MDECKVCANADNEYCFACDNGNQFKPKTNADRIRAMTDEELAAFLTNNQVEVFRKVVKEMCNLLNVYFPYEELTKDVTAKYEEMKKEQLEWLKEEGE
jgi:hypothetical protein